MDKKNAVIAASMSVYVDWLSCRMDGTAKTEPVECPDAHRRLYWWIKEYPAGAEHRMLILLRMLEGTLSANRTAQFLGDRTLLEVVHMRSWALYELAMNFGFSCWGSRP
jgi:hypothetical protein